jgi:4'-phosphopantetheinyl transferase
MKLSRALQELSLPVALQNNGIRLWKIEASEIDLNAGKSCLSADEWERAERVRLGVQRQLFITARVALRHVLADQLGCRPEQVRLAYGPAGRPEVAWPQASLRFNLAHSGRTALLALAPDRPVGVDLEFQRSDVDPLAVGRLVFSVPEMQQLERLAARERIEHFFRLWTAKEAVLKMLGAGFSLEARSICLAHALSGCPSHTPNPATLVGPLHGHLWPLDIGRHHSAALAIGSSSA